MPKTGRPVIKQIRIRSMMGDEDYRRAQRSSLHLHRQFVMPNAKRYFYDFYQISFGPLPLRARVKLGDKAASAFNKDGSVEATGAVEAEEASHGGGTMSQDPRGMDLARRRGAVVRHPLPPSAPGAEGQDREIGRAASATASCSPAR